jgi:uncharacterized membrane protein YGL010W
MNASTLEAAMRHFSRSISLTRVFHTQLAAYAAYHRDPSNCITHLIGIPMLFLAVITPLQALRIPLHHHYIPLAVVLTLPAMALWLMLDLGVGATLVLALCPLFVIAARIAQHGGGAMWGITALLFVVGWIFQLAGHFIFEGRKPAFVDDLSHTLIGPMFVAAKLLMWLGLRRDLVPYLEEVQQDGRTAPFDWVR